MKSNITRNHLRLSHFRITFFIFVEFYILSSLFFRFPSFPIHRHCYPLRRYFDHPQPFLLHYLHLHHHYNCCYCYCSYNFRHSKLALLCQLFYHKKYLHHLKNDFYCCCYYCNIRNFFKTQLDSKLLCGGHIVQND